jgi:hypothetical protein
MQHCEDAACIERDSDSYVRELQSAGLRNVCDLINSAARVIGLQLSVSLSACLSTSLTLNYIYRHVYTQFTSSASLTMNRYSPIYRADGWTVFLHTLEDVA